MPGTNKVFYYLDVNKDGNVEADGFPVGRQIVNDPNDDYLSFSELSNMFNGGADMNNGATSAVVNGHKITLLGATNNDADGRALAYTNTYNGKEYRYDNPDDFLSAKYITDNSDFPSQMGFWTSSLWIWNPNVPTQDMKGEIYQAGMAKVDAIQLGAASTNVLKFIPPTSDSWQGPDVVNNLHVIFMYEMPVI